jgi:hypothetical protein
MPITPQEALHKKVESIPSQVFEAFDELIVKNLQDGRSEVIQEDVVNLISEKLSCHRNIVASSSWLDIEDAYEAAGWHVEYARPGFNESYKAYFTFTAKKKTEA